MPSKNHSRVERRLNVLLTPYEERYDIMAELTLNLPTGERVPDLCLYPKLTFDWEQDEIKMTEPPITAIEILSPTQALNDLVETARRVYLAAGVKSVWIVVPPLKSVAILYPNMPTESFSAGIIHDKATGVQISIDELFK